MVADQCAVMEKDGAVAGRCSVSVVIPTFGRDDVLVETIHQLLLQEPRADEVLVVDQTRRHEAEADQALTLLASEEKIRWIRLPLPSIPHAMNHGLLEARQEIVLFLDDDIVPDPGLVRAHAHAHAAGEVSIVAGRVLQPWESVGGLAERSDFAFSSRRRQLVGEFMGGNFSVKRSKALALGGFDENFVQVAYRFERDFAERVLSLGDRILFEPDASVHHLKVTAGGTRSYGHHLRTVRPSHAVGEYYYLLRRAGRRGWLRDLARRPGRAVMTRYHLLRPWWIPVSLIAEVLGFLWAVRLAQHGPRYIGEGRGARQGCGDA